MEPILRVGILSSKEVYFSLNNQYHTKVLQDSLQGFFHVYTQDSKIVLLQNEVILGSFDNITFYPDTDHGSFVIDNVRIGINFHWERTENQQFEGGLELICVDNKVQVINHIPLEKYLLSVISSEMKATNSLEYLKVHSIVSRSWILAQLHKKHTAVSHQSKDNQFERIIWFDRDDHQYFDVCADDHCQRYQGIKKITNPIVRQAVESTRGMILTYNNQVCDARFSKCCGGVTESFATNWEPVYKPYLKPIRDNNSSFVDLSEESAAINFIMSSPDSYCNTSDIDLLSQIMNDYDVETTHFYRWTVEYKQDELSALIKRKSGIDFGKIMDLIPEERGVSGRISKLRVVGSLKTMIIGKELLIRKYLSESHLYSSAFVVDKVCEDKGTVLFKLFGAGWGHGTGMCQIGAAVMTQKGFDYKSVLAHYYPDSILSQLYN